MTSLEELTEEAECEWLTKWTTGPVEDEGSGLRAGVPAPQFALPDHAGRTRRLSEFWADGPALLIFWRHFGCGCGVERAARLRAEMAGYEAAGLTPVVVSQGEPARAQAYRNRHKLPCPILCDPDHAVYRAYGIGQWSPARILFDAPPEFWIHPHELGATFQNARRESGQPPVDDPWRGVAEFVIGKDGRVRLCHAYQSCEDFPDPRVFTTAARLPE